MPGTEGGARTQRGRGDLRRPLLPGSGPLARVSPLLAFLVVVLVFGAGVLVGGVVGTLLLGLLVVGVGALLATTWARLGAAERAGRMLVLAVLVGVTLVVALR